MVKIMSEKMIKKQMSITLSQDKILYLQKLNGKLRNSMFELFVDKLIESGLNEKDKGIDFKRFDIVRVKR